LRLAKTTICAVLRKTMQRSVLGRMPDKEVRLFL
jgi:hypothetical protein